MCLRPSKPLCILYLLMNTILHIDPLEIEEARCFYLLIQVHGLLADVALITLLFRLRFFFIFYMSSHFFPLIRLRYWISPWKREGKKERKRFACIYGSIIHFSISQHLCMSIDLNSRIGKLFLITSNRRQILYTDFNESNGVLTCRRWLTYETNFLYFSCWEKNNIVSH